MIDAWCVRAISSQAFDMLKNIWKAGKLGLKTKFRLFTSKVLVFLLYGAGLRKMPNTKARHWMSLKGTVIVMI